MIAYDGPVLFDCVVDKTRTASDDPLGQGAQRDALSDYLGETGVELGDVISEEGKMLV